MYLVMSHEPVGNNRHVYFRVGKLFNNLKRAINLCNKQPKYAYVLEYGKPKPVYINGMDVENQL